MKEQGGEMFYVKDGKRCDAELHAEFLDGVDGVTDEHIRSTTALWAIQNLGVDPADAARIYGLKSAYDLGPGPEPLR